MINYGLHYIQSNNELNYLIFPEYKIETFFNTKEFNDIAWTRYWYGSCNKEEMKYLICNITEDESYMNLQKNNCKISPRKELDVKNYNNSLLQFNYY